MNACVPALPLLLLTAVVDVGGDVHGRVVVRGQPFKVRVLRKVRSDPVLPALRVVGIQLGRGMRRGGGGIMRVGKTAVSSRVMKPPHVPCSSQVSV